MNTNVYSDLHVRLDTKVKHKAEEILDELGIAPSGAINMFYRQIIVHDGLPFKVVRSAGPLKNIDDMTTQQINAELEAAEAEISEGKFRSVDEAFQSILGDKYAKI